jgi:CelD/BcsL family acetyltransferase involved in cellulose biosynthesis
MALSGEPDHLAMQEDAVAMDFSVSEDMPQMSLKDSEAQSVAKLLTSRESLAAALPDWDGSPLGANALTPMQTKPWIQACAETFSHGGELRVVVLEDDRGIAAIAPFVRREAFPAVNELLGLRELSEPSDLIYRDEAALKSLIEVISRDRTPLDLERVVESSPSVEAIRNGFRGSAVVRVRPENNLPHIAIPPGSMGPEQLLGSRLRSDLRRAQRKAEAQGKVTYEIHAPRTADEFLPLFEQALKVEAAGWKGAGGFAVAKDALQRAFFNRYGVLASEAGVLRLAFTRIDGAVAAMQYAVQWNAGFWLLKVGYDETYSKCSPGQLLMQHTLRYAAQQGLRSYEFLGSAETWTQRWTTAERTTVRIVVYPYSPTGMITLGRDLLRALQKKAAARLARRQPISQTAEAAPPSTTAEGE